MPSQIISIGTASPKNWISQNEGFLHAKSFFCNDANRERILKRLYKRTTIKQRASVLPLVHDESQPTANQNFYEPTLPSPSTKARMEKYQKEAPALAVTACENALTKCAVDPRQITHLINVSCTGFASPGVDIALIKSLRLPEHVSRTNVGFMGCHGVFNALRVADAFVQADKTNVVLICAVEICTLHFQYGWGTDNLVANSLFADGAGDVLVTSADADLCYVKGSSLILPNTETSMTWSITDEGFAMTLGSEVPLLIREGLRDFVEQWLMGLGLSISDVGGWAVHPGGPKILDAVESALNLNKNALNHSREVLGTYGNMSSPTVLFVLQKIIANKVAPPYVMLGFGPGLTIEAALII